MLSSLRPMMPLVGGFAISSELALMTIFSIHKRPFKMLWYIKGLPQIEI